MEINWTILIIVLVCEVALILYLIKRNMKDKDDLVKFMNETEIEDYDKEQRKEDDSYQKLN
jgi:hypothetical protein